MKMSLEFFLWMALVMAPVGLWGEESCEKCNKVQGLPGDGQVAMIDKSLTSLAAVAKADEKKEYIQKYCMAFKQMSPNEAGLIIKQMKNDGYSVDDFFAHTECRMDRSPTDVHSPMIHYVAEDPAKREKILTTFETYYRKVAKDEGLFKKAINLKNTKGETLLDYIEVLRGMKTFDTGENEKLQHIVSFLCKHGGIYSTTPKDKRDCISQ